MALSLFLASFCFKIPHPSKLKTNGEDACFVSEVNNAVGMADGVGGWATTPGSNAWKYSNDLMEYANEFSNLSTPLDILDRAFEVMDKSIIGSSTATVAKLIGDRLYITNVGDSGCSVFRDFTHIYHTKPTLHGFNFPYQLGMGSDTVPANGTHEWMVVEPGDTIVCASDGLWDNVYEKDMEQILIQTHSWAREPGAFAAAASRNLAQRAMENGASQESETPFSDEVKKQGHDYSGGKLDDTTVVVSQVCDRTDEL